MLCACPWDLPSSFWVRQHESARQKMQLALQALGHRAQGIAAPHIVFGAMAIFGIAEDRMADRLGVRAQLMRAPGKRLHGKPCAAGRRLVDDGVVGQRVLRVSLAVAVTAGPGLISVAKPNAPPWEVSSIQ